MSTFIFQFSEESFIYGFDLFTEIREWIVYPFPQVVEKARSGKQTRAGF